MTVQSTTHPSAAGTTPKGLRTILVRLLDEAYSKTGWIDRSLRRSLRGVETTEALFRPASGRHNIWEQVVHLAYWKHVLHRRITGEEPVPFGEKGKDWFPRAADDEGAWKRDRRKLADVHARLRAAVLEKKELSANDVDRIVGAAFHDVYHAAQIELTRRLHAESGHGRASG